MRLLDWVSTGRGAWAAIRGFRAEFDWCSVVRLERVETDGRLLDVLVDVIRRRESGEFVADAEVLAAHPELADELGPRLNDLRRIDDAQIVAESTSVQSGADSDVGAADTARDWVLASIPGYELLEELHRGGQGVVFRARQISTGRDVAIKIVRDGPFLGPRDKARFDREVRVLAKLRHPHIVAIHDSGVTAGCHYFAMDFVDGRPIDEYVRKAAPPLRERVRLFAQVCAAVNAAHLLGVIHRDLKPRNIMVDSAGQPRILDFGLARFADDSSDHSHVWRTMTQTGQFVGSLPWASPEQVCGTRVPWDTRTDVYTLGVVLYQMLCGCFPYNATVAPREALNAIVETPPRRLRVVDARIDVDLERVVLKCLAKEPQKRYETAGALGEDLRRYLAGEPILARRPSLAYQLRKLALRHRFVSALLLSLMVVVATAFFVIAGLYVRANDSAERAQREARIATEVQRLFTDVIEAANMFRSGTDELTVREFLDQAAGRIERVALGDVRLEAALHKAVADAYDSLDRYAEAAAHYRSAIDLFAEESGDAVRDEISARMALAATLGAQDRLEEARRVSDDASEQARTVLGDSDALTLAARVAAIGHAFAVGDYRTPADELEQIVAQRERWERINASTCLSALTWWSDVLMHRGDLEGAEAVTREVLAARVAKHGPDSLEVASCQSQLSRLLQARERYDEAAALSEHVYERSVRLFGARHRQTLGAKFDLAMIRRDQMRMDEAERLFRDLLDASRGVVGVEGARYQQAVQYLSSIYYRREEHAEAVRLLEELVALRRDRDAPASDVAFALTSLGANRCKLGRFDGAVRALRESRGIFVELNDRNGQGWALLPLAISLNGLGEVAEAEAMARELLELRIEEADRPDASVRELGLCARDLVVVEPEYLRDAEAAIEFARVSIARNPETEPSLLAVLAIALQAGGRFADAAEEFRLVLARVPNEPSISRDGWERRLVACLEALGRTDEAERVLRDTLVARRAAYGAGHSHVAAALDMLGVWLLRQGRYDGAGETLRESVTIRESIEDSSSWRLRLGRVLVDVAHVGVGSDRADTSMEVVRLGGELDQIVDAPIRAVEEVREVLEQWHDLHGD